MLDEACRDDDIETGGQSVRRATFPAQIRPASENSPEYVRHIARILMSVDLLPWVRPGVDNLTARVYDIYIRMKFLKHPAAELWGCVHL